ncbi:hypothetical protein HK096_005461 [Nowakowskiella sp. JEL0078]|nr:hypothetical protein HK096_005461 [Nowakowskiella sp. JEL0078]
MGDDVEDGETKGSIEIEEGDLNYQVLSPGDDVSDHRLLRNTPKNCVDIFVVLPVSTAPLPEPIMISKSSVHVELNGIELQTPHLARQNLVTSITEKFESNRFVLLSSPAGSGKTSLLQIFQHRVILVDCIYVSSFESADRSLTGVLTSAGIDLKARTFPVVNGTVVIMLDDAQFTYEDRVTWSLFIKSAVLWLPSNIKFIISATHSLKGGQESPVEFTALPKLNRKDFLLSYAESNEFLDSVIGLPTNMKSGVVKQVIIRDCGSLIGALRVAVNSLKLHFHKSYPLEEELLQYYFSAESLSLASRIFGSEHTSPMNEGSKNMLAQCFQSKSASYSDDLTENEMKFFLVRQKARILVENDCKEIEFSSQLARRYYISWLFPIDLHRQMFLRH